VDSLSAISLSAIDFVAGRMFWHVAPLSPLHIDRSRSEMWLSRIMHGLPRLRARGPSQIEPRCNRRESRHEISRRSLFGICQPRVRRGVDRKTNAHRQGLAMRNLRAVGPSGP